MAFELQFAPVLAQAPVLIDSFWLTIKLSVSAVFLGGSVGLLAAMVILLLAFGGAALARGRVTAATLPAIAAATWSRPTKNKAAKTRWTMRRRSSPTP